MRAETGPDKAEFAAYSGRTVKNDNTVWPDFRRNPKGRAGPFFDFRGRLLPLSSALAVGKIPLRRCRPIQCEQALMSARRLMAVKAIV